MKKIFLILTALSLFGIGCQKSSDEITAEKIQQALAQTAKNYGWAESIISKEPGEENFYSNSYLLYGPSKESGLENVIDKIEVLQFVSSAAAEKVYKDDACFKGAGKPFTIAGISGCCLNNVKEQASKAIMTKDEYIFRADNHFLAGCKATEYLKNFWKNL